VLANNCLQPTLRLSRRLHSELKSAMMENGKRRARRAAAEAKVRPRHRKATGHENSLANNHAGRYYSDMIKSFKSADTEAIAKGLRVKRFMQIEAVVRRKLRQLEIAGDLEDLRIPPGNRLELLVGDRRGQHSIRINDQFRLCFQWTDGGPEDVEIVDYHGKKNT
jgi:proteic killer suppression protein